jgi:glycosyltransferase involved in cell wall biosynthesis
MGSIAIVPAFNEENTIKEVISRLRKVKITPIIVDDGSTDQTYKLAKGLGVTVIKHENNKGKGEALKTGFNFILKNLPNVNYILIFDADMQYKAEESEKILQPLKKNKADIVMGYRNWKEVPIANKIGNSIWRILFNYFFDVKLKDTNCGFIGLTRNAIKKIENVHGGYIIENSMLRDAVKNELRIKQVPVTVTYRKKRTLHFARMFFGILIFIIVEGIKYKLSKI